MNRFKKLIEERAKHCQEMESLVNGANGEERALTEEEQARFEELEKKVAAIDATIEADKKAREKKMEEPTPDDDDPSPDDKPTDEEKEKAEERAFADFIRGVVSEERADANLTTGENGAVIPSHIANKIIQRVHEICPIYQMATKYNISGTLSIPYYDESEQSITMAYATEFTDLESSSGKFKSIELKGFLGGVLTKIAKSLVNNSEFDIVNFVINAMAESVSRWLENEVLNGTTDKIDGLSKVKQVVESASGTAITSDELIDLQETVPDIFQPGCVWIMNKETRTVIRKLKDNDGNYILNKDATARWGYELFGADVYTSENMPKMEAGKIAIYYGDMSGLAIKLTEDVSIEVLREKFATQHAIGVVGWMEVDSKIENEQKIAALKMKTA